jgi:SAM-dependent methyltransferase
VSTYTSRFGQETSEKMVNWALEHVPPSSRPAILEVGSGNGVLLLGLLEAGYDGTRLYGVDYSEGAVELAQAVADSRGKSSVTYTKSDFLLDDPPSPDRSSESGTASWDLILDKGTYDAIALATKDAEGRSPAIHYPGRVAHLLKSGGIFLITCR